VTDQPERNDGVRAEPLQDQVDHVLQMLVIGLRDPVPRRLRRGGGGRGDDQAVRVRVVVRGEVQVLPRAERAAAVQVQQERERPARDVVGRVQVELPAGGLIDDRLMAHSDLLALPPRPPACAAARQPGF
jgi:hypothetical protein